MLPVRLECSLDAAHRYSPEVLASTCPQDGAPLLARYGVDRLSHELVRLRPWTMWRYREMLPVGADEEPISLGEGATPLIRASALEGLLECAPVYVKDEAQNPTGSFKARGMSVAVSAAKRLGANALVAPSAGNAGGALAAYGARAGLPVRVYVPADTPELLLEEMRGYAAEVVLVAGLIDDAGRLAAEYARESGAFNVATFREPYRVEGKKTMGYELVEQLGGIPGTIVYPTGGGTGLVAMWKAFDELAHLGWIGEARPVMVCVQAEGCAPIVTAYARGEASAQRVEAARTKLWGLRVPGGIGDRLTLSALRASSGFAIAVSDEESERAMREIHHHEGIDATEEGGATLAALKVLRARGVSLPLPIVLFNTAGSLKYAPRRAVS
ncbi:MAG TPA: threonine synthase [Candidatus Cybelea sp.]|jgi:threonine synthase|nr:threonine synthase [Candidatus Cybelea sp.]